MRTGLSFRHGDVGAASNAMLSRPLGVIPGFIPGTQGAACSARRAIPRLSTFLICGPMGPGNKSRDDSVREALP
jgi:hypothetical protein